MISWLKSRTMKMTTCLTILLSSFLILSIFLLHWVKFCVNLCGFRCHPYQPSLLTSQSHHQHHPHFQHHDHYHNTAINVTLIVNIMIIIFNIAIYTNLTFNIMMTINIVLSLASLYIFIFAVMPQPPQKVELNSRQHYNLKANQKKENLSWLIY